MITARQIRAGRALIAMTQRDLGRLSEVPEPTLKRIESDNIGPSRSSAGSIDRIVTVLRENGVVFVEDHDGTGEGVLYRPVV